MKSLKIGLDFDDVLYNFNYGFLEHYNALNGTSFTRSQIVDYHLHFLLGGTKEEMFDMIDAFYTSDSHKKVMPVSGAVEHVKHLEKHELILISARPEHTRGAVMEWLDLHFPNVFEKIHLTGLYRGEREGVQSKEEIALEHAVDVFVEDSIRHAKNISQVGIPVILLDTPWNQGEIPKGVTRVFSWEEVIENIKKLEE